MVKYNTNNNRRKWSYGIENKALMAIPITIFVDNTPYKDIPCNLDGITTVDELKLRLRKVLADAEIVSSLSPSQYRLKYVAANGALAGVHKHVLGDALQSRDFRMCSGE